MFSLLKNLFSKKKSEHYLNPEDDYTVIITDEYVEVNHPKRNSESIFWNEINEIWLVNTDDGPFLPDIFLVLIGDNSGCSLPQGAKGYDEVYNIISKYDNFNFENVIDSMACVDNQRFILWKRNN